MNKDYKVCLFFVFRYSKEPMFVKKPRSSDAYEGDTVIIQCEVIGDPKPDVVWLRDFLKVSSDYRKKIVHKSLFYKL